ncbi:heme exporter protein CcmD [Burkholderiales bacterium GJ-E10]|nr:heme exporter protein CcmD [Burkholderiales bacterium GJ-E10]
MKWASMHAFFAMGGYARFVWGSYGVVAVALLIEVVNVRARLARARKRGAAARRK